METDHQPLILIVEDEKSLAQAIGEQIEASGMEAKVFNNSKDAMDFAAKTHVHLVLLDINLPDLDGFSTLARLRALPIPPAVIFITGNASVGSKVKGLNQGGDDYLTKPFSYEELIARVRAVLRRVEKSREEQVDLSTPESTDPFDFCGARVNPSRLEMACPSGEVVSLRPKELGVIQLLHQNQGKVVLRPHLIRAVWGKSASLKSRSLDQYLVNIRSALQKNGADPSLLRTIHSVGYIYEGKDGAG